MKIGVDAEDSEEQGEDSECEYDYTEPNPEESPVPLYDKYQKEVDKDISHVR